MKWYCDKYFPMKNITISNLFFTEELRILRRRRQRAYNNHGKNELYMKISSEFHRKLLREKKKYKAKIIDEVKNGKRGSSYSSLKKMSFRSDQLGDREYVLSNHRTEGLSDKESADRIADYFSQISQEFEPLCPDRLPPNIRNCLLEEEISRAYQNMMFI